MHNGMCLRASLVIGALISTVPNQGLMPAGFAGLLVVAQTVAGGLLAVEHIAVDLGVGWPTYTVSLRAICPTPGPVAGPVPPDQSSHPAASDRGLLLSRNCCS